MSVYIILELDIDVTEVIHSFKLYDDYCHFEMFLHVATAMDN